MGWMFCICDGRQTGRYKAPSHLFLPGENAPTVHSGIYSSNKEVHLIKKIHLKDDIQQEKIPMKKSNEKQEVLFLLVKMLP